jgi:arylsulfatase A-like enzyme
MGLDRGFAEFREIYNDPQLGSRAEVFRKKAYDWFAQNGQKRFFAYLHFREPHAPFDPPPEFRTMFGPDAPLKISGNGWNTWMEGVNQGKIRPTREEVEHLVRLYDGNLAYVDREVGALRAMLEAQGLWDKTLVIIMADHGDQLYEDGYVGHSAQVREESARVPLIVHFPTERGPHGLRVPGLVDLTDVAPTIAEVFGVMPDAPELKSFQGQSLFDVMAGAPGDSAALVRSVWLRPVYAITDGKAKLVYETRTGVEHLFLLEQDSDERKDVAAGQPVLAAFCRQALHHWVAQLLAQPRPQPDISNLTPEQRQNLCSLGYLTGADCR